MIAADAILRFRTLLATRLGWAFADTDSPHLARALERRAAAHELTPEAYLDRLGAGGWTAEIDALAEDLTITETYFFRHSAQFRALAEAVLPERLAARAGERTLRLLSVGTSSGEEAYTLAMVAREAQPDPGWAVSVLGLDANPAMLRKAVTARYSGWSLRETPDAVRRQRFHAGDGGYEVAPEIRALVRFQQDNVADSDASVWQPGRYDVIFCRNLLMYLTPAAAAALVRRMTRSLAPGGYLFLGHTDTLGSRPDGLEPRHSHGTFYYRRVRPGAPPEPPRHPAARSPQTPRRPAATPAGSSAVSAPPPAPAVPAPAPAAEAGTGSRVLALMGQERFAEALAVLDHADAGPVPRERLLRGVLLAQAGRLDEAEIAVRRLLDDSALDADAHHLLGVCLEGGASVDVAIGHYRLAAYLDPAFAMPRLRLGLLARRRGDDRTAGAELDRALPLLHAERDDRLLLFGGGFGRISLVALCRNELDAATAPRGGRR